VKVRSFYPSQSIEGQLTEYRDLRFALGLVWVLLIVAETISAQAGIGYMTMNAREFLHFFVKLPT
jgi:hypothetical protein